MNLERSLLFFFSAIGAFNGLFLFTYYTFFIKNRTKATYFLAAFLLAVSVRVIKSVFLYFYSHIPELFAQIGLSACSLIGPFLFLYVSSGVENKKYSKNSWLMHALPGLLFVIFFTTFYPSWESSNLFNAVYFIDVLYAQWIIYIILAGLVIKDSFKKLFLKNEVLTDEEIWQTSVVIGTGIIWAAYNFCQYTSYISGAVSFSFIFYLLLLLWIFKRRNVASFFEKQVKYGNKIISTKEAEAIASKLEGLLLERKLYKNPDLKLPDLANELAISSHSLSQYLNDNLGKRFSTFINGYRIAAAEEMLKGCHHLTLEAIGNECGFKSNSAFYAAFKKFKGITPARFKRG